MTSGSFWPDERLRGLLQVALGPLDEAADRWQALQPLDVSKLPTGSFAVLPPLYERLAAVAPDELQLPLLHGTYRSTWYRNQLLLDRLARLLPPLAEKGIVPIVVGGADAVQRWYPGLGSRPVAPLELVVEPAAVPVAREACRADGWRPAGSTPALARFVGEANAPLLVHPGAPSPLAGPLGRQDGYEALRAQARTTTCGDHEHLVLDPADELLRLCAAGARTVLPPSVQWLVDAHRLLASAEAPAVERLGERARLFRVAEPLRATLLYLSNVLEQPGLEEYVRSLVPMRGNRRERLAFRLAGVPGGRLIGPAQIVAAHLQASADGSVSRAVTRLPRHLQDTWQTAGPTETVAHGLRKTARLLR